MVETRISLLNRRGRRPRRPENTNGKNKYYFDGNQLKAVEIIEGGKTVMVMRFLEYSNEIPDGVYFAPPKGYKATTLQIEGSDIFYDDVFGK